MTTTQRLLKQVEALSTRDQAIVCALVTALRDAPARPRAPHSGAVGTSSAYLVRAEAAAYVRTTIRGFDHWVASRGVPSVRRGRIRLFRRDVLDRVMASDATSVSRRQR